MFYIVLGFLIKKQLPLRADRDLSPVRAGLESF